MRNFFNLGRKLTRAKEIPSLTQFLVNNPMFRNFVMMFHNGKANAMNNLDEYLEKELLTKEQYDAKYKAKRIDQSKKNHRNHTNRQ